MNTINATSVPIRGALPDYWGSAADYPHQPIDLAPWEVGARAMTPLERATIRIIAPDLAHCPGGSSLVHEAVVRLAIWKRSNQLSHSGTWIARSLQRAMLSVHPNGLRSAHKGFALLAAVDAAELGVEVWTTFAPEGVRGPFSHVRLGALCASRTLGTDSERHRTEIG
ncbi:hypothetical protein ACFOE1_05190 [Agromyces mediolanus]|uniref:Uncharacterized protein n=1 Tax=Agromyces mediolanus TaxID=41986 RepID=A0A918FD61_AGRME|nr:hypothetical protein [Agromyces mediolanus]GGR28909.1 hypothetical protein GCM10010196_23470 [Agromyces mediolanus]GLJ72143.1 hypothetical protein GCM10017583_13990 [Agromyces mediolanus]